MANFTRLTETQGCGEGGLPERLAEARQIEPRAVAAGEPGDDQERQPGPCLACPSRQKDPIEFFGIVPEEYVDIDAILPHARRAHCRAVPPRRLEIETEVSVGL